MDTSRIPLICALGALASWTVKAVTVGLDGGADSTLASVLMAVGLAFALAAGVGVAAILSRGLSVWRRAGAMVLGVVTGPALGLTLNLAIESVVESDHWAWAEVNLWVMAVLLVAVASRVGRRDRAGTERAAVAALV